MHFNCLLKLTVFLPLFWRRVNPLKAAAVSLEKASSLMKRNMHWPTRGRSCRKLLSGCRTLMMRTEHSMWVYIIKLRWLKFILDLVRLTSKCSNLVVVLFFDLLVFCIFVNVIQRPHVWSMCPSQIEEQIESMFNSKKRVKDLSAPGSSSGSSGASTTTATVAGGLPGFGPTSAGNIQKLEMAKRLALKINAQKNLGAEAQVC